MSKKPKMQYDQLDREERERLRDYLALHCVHGLRRARISTFLWHLVALLTIAVVFNHYDAELKDLLRRVRLAELPGARFEFCDPP